MEFSLCSEVSSLIFGPLNNRVAEKAWTKWQGGFIAITCLFESWIPPLKKVLGCLQLQNEGDANPFQGCDEMSYGRGEEWHLACRKASGPNPAYCIGNQPGGHSSHFQNSSWISLGKCSNLERQIIKLFPYFPPKPGTTPRDATSLVQRLCYQWDFQGNGQGTW